MKLPGVVLAAYLLSAYLLLVVAGSLLFLRDGVLMALFSPLLGVFVLGAALRMLAAERAAKAWGIIATVAIAIIGALNLPVRAVFRLYEPRFEAMAEQLHRGDTPAFPQWIGPFRIVGTVERGGIRALVLDPAPGGMTAFVRDPQGLNFNLWSCTPVSRSWSLVNED